MELKEKIIVVTGGASGIGRALCRRFAAEGARAVVVVDMNAAGAAEVAAEIGSVAMTADVSTEADVARVIDHTERDIGPIDLFCSNAGIAVPGGVETSDEVWQKSWDVNVMSHIYAARTLVPRMINRGWGLSAEYRLSCRLTQSDRFGLLWRDQTRRGRLWGVVGADTRAPGHQGFAALSPSGQNAHAGEQREQPRGER